MQRPDRPDQPGDPYRILGLERGAAIADVKRAYRRMAKQTHPDATGAGAGPAAVRRFLLIQAAYQAILAAATSGAAPARPAAPRDAEARRAAWRRSRPGAGAGRAGGSAGPASGGSGGSSAGARASGGPSRGGSAGSSSGPAQDADPDGVDATPEEIARRRASLGSTSYDDAPMEEPEWDGGSWYGVSSGTYWTVNPREYADPRKHGPEYQSRGRRPPGEDVDRGR